MAEHDDGLSRRYRAASREEPPAAIDAAILAASRRAVGARPGGVRRWAGPISIAAVLMLGVGVSLRMQQERPGIETSAPMAEQAAPARSAQAPSAQAPSPSMQAAPQATAPSVLSDSAPARRDAPAARTEKRATSAAKPSAARDAAPLETDALQKRTAEANVAQAPQLSQPRVPEAAATFAAPPPAAPAAPVAPAAPAAAPAPLPQSAAPPAALAGARSKREALAAASDATREGADGRDPVSAELERIARLRAEGRDAEADKALEEFRRKHPDHRIDDATWQRVRPR